MHLQLKYGSEFYLPGGAMMHLAWLRWFRTIPSYNLGSRPFLMHKW